MFKEMVKGKVWKFGDNISTDYIQPGFEQGNTLEEKAQFCMRSIRPEFAQGVKPGDIVVGGKNFGCGSSRPAGQNFVALGVGCVVAESFSRLFFRNSINLGLPLLSCKGVSDTFEEGDMLEADFRTGEVRNLTKGKVLRAAPLPEVAIRFLRAGGVVALLKQEYGKKQ